jgi:hypothetical protein
MMRQAVARDVLLEGRHASARRRTELRAAIGHALRFMTWRSLARESHLSEKDAVQLMVSLVLKAVRGR